MNQPINILLIEDDELDIENIERAFKKANFANPVSTARDGEEGIRALRKLQSSVGRLLVLLDLNMPRKSGFEVLREMRADPALKNIPVVILTTSNEDRDKTEAYQHHVAGYLLKPVTFTNFVELMSALNHYWQLVEFAPTAENEHRENA